MEDYRKQVRDQILRGRLVNREVKSKIVITDEDIQACYIENKDQYCGEKKYHIRHILMKVPSFANDDEKAAVRRRMEAVMERLDAGESFADLASTYTESPLRDEGGDLGAFELKGLSPPIRKAVENLQAGAHSGIVDTDQGLQIFYLEEVIEQPDQPIEEVRAEIETRLYNQIVDEKFESWLAELRRKSHIRIIR
jgi:peptidyl-prolyl cis-trans isomerase SurA